MFEIDNEFRGRILCSIGDIELQTFIKIGEKIYARPEQDTDRTSEEVKLHLFTSFTLILKIKKLKSL